MGVLNNGGNLLAINAFYLQIAIGVLILVAVGFDQLNTPESNLHLTARRYSPTRLGERPRRSPCAWPGRRPPWPDCRTRACRTSGANHAGTPLTKVKGTITW